MKLFEIKNLKNLIYLLISTKGNDFPTIKDESPIQNDEFSVK